MDRIRGLAGRARRQPACGACEAASVAGAARRRRTGTLSPCVPAISAGAQPRLQPAGGRTPAGADPARSRGVLSRAAAAVAPCAGIFHGGFSAPGARPARLSAGGAAAVCGAIGGLVRGGAVVARVDLQRARPRSRGGNGADVRPRRSKGKTGPRERRRSGDVRLLRDEQRQHRAAYVRQRSAGRRGHHVCAGDERIDDRRSGRPSAGCGSRRPVLAVRRRAFGAGTYRHCAGGRRRAADRTGSGRTRAAAARRRADRRRQSRCEIVSGHLRDAGVRGVRGSVLVVDRLDAGVDQIHCRRRAVDVDVGMAGVGWAKRVRLRGTAA